MNILEAGSMFLQVLAQALYVSCLKRGRGFQ